MHRRFGKTVFAVNELVDRALRCELKNPRYAYIAPFYSQAKRVAWDYFKEFTRMIPGVNYNESELRIDIPLTEDNVIKIQLLGAENPNSLRGVYLDGVILDEYADMDPVVWSQIVRPALSDRLGWAVFIGTPKGQNHFFKLFRAADELSRDAGSDWVASLMRASDTQIIAESELQAAKVTMSEDEFEQEYECSWVAAAVGHYYAKQMAVLDKLKRFTKVSYDPTLPVHTAWDLGISDTTCIWFWQNVGKEIHIVDYAEGSGMGLDHYATILKSKGYSYGSHKLPHDGAARELGTGRTRQETLESLGIDCDIVERQSVQDGINAVRTILPRCWFNTEANADVARGVDALWNYQRKWDSKNQVYMQRPLHNWASHAADSFRILAQSIDDVSQGVIRSNTNRRGQTLPRESNSDYDVFS
jgi:phage terminase large subunit